MNFRTSTAATTILVSMLFASSAAGSEITGTLTAGSGTSVSGSVEGPPAATPAPGTYANPVNVTFAAPGSFSIRYSADGSSPSCSGGGQLYTSAIPVSSSTLTILAISCYPNGDSSSVGSYAYVISPNSLSGTVATSSGGSLSGSVTSSPGGTLSGTVIAPSSGGGGGGSSGGGGGGGGGNGPPINLGSGVGGGGGGIISPTGSVLGSSTSTIPNIPNTGAGGDATAALAGLLFSGLAVFSGLAPLLISSIRRR